MVVVVSIAGGDVGMVVVWTVEGCGGSGEVGDGGGGMGV